jgi:TetR/AcrR family fatty acid metabolism transcriptional regulator
LKGLSAGINMNKKESIRNHAIKVIAREGFYRAKVKDIAEEAGIAAGTVYLYFSSKEDILDYIFLVEHQRRADFVNRLYIKNTPIDIVIESFIKFNYDCFREEPETANVLYRELITVSSLKNQKSKSVMGEVYKSFYKILKQEKENGKIREDIDIEVMSPLIINFLRNSSYNILAQYKSVDYEHMKENLKRLVLHGIMK